MSAHNFLNVSPEIYELMVLSKYLTWCSTHSCNHTELQKLMTNQSLLDWFLAQYRKLERDFCDEITPYAAVATQRDAVKLYEDNVRKIYLYFATPLIEAAKKGT